MSILKRYAEKYGTDKAGFGYTDIYEKYLSTKRHSVLRVLEIGIKSGASLRMWKEYFPKATICGLDIDRSSLFEDSRIVTHCFDQGSNNVGYDGIIQIMGNAGLVPFDVIVDDGSHWQPHILKSFEQFYPLLRTGGYYFIEDVANERISLKNGKTWGSIKTDFSDAAIKVFEKNKNDGAKNITIFYAQEKPLTEKATSDFIVIQKD
jgi:SAM-dependent methyltransferase